METSLHRQLKQVYCDSDARLEVSLGRYRIDVVSGSRLVEIQHGSLAAIRDKVRHLLRDHQVTVVKPIVARKLLVRCQDKDGSVLSRRTSPKRGRLVDLFDDLVYFTRVFPHHNLSLEVPLVEIEEHRYPGHGRRRRWRRNDFQVADQKLIRVDQIHRFETAADLLRIVPTALPSAFDTSHLAESLDVPRWIAQRVAYCLRKMGAILEVGKQGNTRLYSVPDPGKRPARRRERA